MSRPILAAPAWPYANGPRHIGHVSGFALPCDMFARYQRMAGNQVLMVSGTDEHGTPIQVQADAEGVTTRALVDRYNRIIAEDLVSLDMSYDLFTRTTTVNHYAVVQDLFLGLYDNGYIFPRKTLGAISPSTGRTLPDRYLEGTCPICGYESARGDQCDNCGNQLDPSDLISPRSRINGETPAFVETEQFFLDLPAFTDVLGTWLQGKSGQWRPNVLKFSLNLLADLQPRAITRDLDWGVPIPLDGWRDRPDKRIYVWFDAVIGYLSASIEWAQRSGDPDAWRQYWQGPDAESYYFMGKDNIVFHSEIWPAMLLGYSGQGARGGKPGSLGELDLPSEVVSSEYLTMEGRKFSSSRSVVIYVRDLLSRYDVDALRYYVAVAGPENQDTDFTWSEFIRRNNDELVANWGNLVNRSVSFAARNLGSIPEPGQLTDADHDDPAPVPRLVRRDRRPARPVPVQGGGHRGHAHGRRGQQVPVRPCAVEAARVRPGPDGHDPARRPAAGRRRQDAADPVPARVVAEGGGHAGRLRPVVRDAGVARGQPGRRPRLSGHHRRLPRRRGALGQRADPAGHAAGRARAAVRQDRPEGGRRGTGPAGQPRDPGPPVTLDRP